MARKSIIVGSMVSAVCCSLASCVLDFHRVDSPPKEHADAVRWWLETPDHIPADIRAVYVAAADAHRKRNSSATYVDTQYATTMVSRVRSDLRLPCPPPPVILARLREQVRPGDVDPEWSARLVAVHAEACVGCSKAEAERIWQVAIETARAAGPGKQGATTPPPSPLNPGGGK